MTLDIDTFRRRLARIITMYTNEWHGCSELICKRNRGGMAPDGRCSNLPELSPEEARAAWWKVRDEVALALQAGMAARRAAEGVTGDDL